MAEYLDFFNIYIMGVIEMSFQFYFLAKILKKKMVSFLFPVCSMCSDCGSFSFGRYDHRFYGACLSAYGMRDICLPCGF